MKSLQDLQCVPGFHIEIFTFVRIINKITTVVLKNLKVRKVNLVRGNEHERSHRLEPKNGQLNFCQLAKRANYDLTR